MGMKTKSPEKTIYGVANAGHDPPALATIREAADPPEISPPFPLLSSFSSSTFSHLPLL
jgi:hypothetical protein